MSDFWDERYAEKEFVYGSLPNQFLKIQLDKLKAGKILFAVEGEGRNAVYAAKQNWQVDAFDLSEEGKKKALRLAKQNNVSLTYQIQDATIITYPENSFDAIALIYAHFPAAYRKAVHHKIVNWLKPEGILIVEAFNPMQLNNSSGGPKELSMLYTKEMLQNDFKDLSIQQLSMETTTLDEGTYHRGKADVIRFIGKKQKQFQ